MRFLTNGTRFTKEGTEVVWQVWEMCDHQSTEDFLHIRRVATIPGDYLRLISPGTFQQQLLLGTEVKA